MYSQIVAKVARRHAASASAGMLRGSKEGLPSLVVS